MTPRPSSLPMLSACPCFESGPTEWTEGGTNRHRYLHLIYLTDPEFNGLTRDQVAEYAIQRDTLAVRMSDEEIDACNWAYDYIKLTAALNDHPIYFERKMSCTLSDFSTMEGTPDVTCWSDLFDLKWRERDYSSQMAAYALMMFEENPALEYVRVHIMFGAIKKIAPVYSLTREQAENIVEDAIESTKTEHDIMANGSASSKIIHEPQPRACDYCGWCKKQLTCPAVTSPVKQVAIGYGDGKPPEIISWHPSEMKTAEQIAFALTICRKILKPWIESMEFHAVESAKNGLSLPGYELKPTKGRSSISDVVQAHALSGLPQAEFLKCCDVRMNTSKTYPDRVGIIEIYAAKNEMKKAPAKRAILEKLAQVIATGKDGFKLTATNDQESDNE